MWNYALFFVDFVLTSQQLTFPSGSSSSSGSIVCTTTLQPENDDILELAVETFHILLNSSDPAVIISPPFDSAIVSITEDIRDGGLQYGYIVHSYMSLFRSSTLQMQELGTVY